MQSATEIFELLCWDDADLLQHMGVLEEMSDVFIWIEEDETDRKALLKFNKKFSLGFLSDKESNAVYFLVNEWEFHTGINQLRGRYEREIQKICAFFGKKDDKDFVNKLLLPWVCKVLEVHFENVDLSEFLF
jgi:hypothetical protein